MQVKSGNTGGGFPTPRQKIWNKCEKCLEECLMAQNLRFLGEDSGSMG